MSKEEGERARRHGKVFTEGGPGGCKSEAECNAYCNGPDHAEECVQFGVDEGVIAPEEAKRLLERARRAPRLGRARGPAFAYDGRRALDA